MTYDDAMKQVKRLGALFPGEINSDQSKHAARKLMGFSFADVREAVSQHREMYQSINWPAFYEACKPSANPSRRSVQDETFAAVIRRQRPDLAGRSDAEVVLRYWRGDWWRYKANADSRLKLMVAAIESGHFGKAMRERGATEEEVIKAQTEAMERHDRQFNGYQAKCLRSCTGTLIETGMPADEAERWAKSILEDANYFQLCLSDLRPLPAMEGAVA